MIKTRSLYYFDWFSFGCTLALSLCGLLSIYSATYSAKVPFSLFFKKQCFGIISGIFIYFVCTFIDYRRTYHIMHIAYIALLALLAFTLIKGSIGMGAQRWIDLGLIRFQPSELCKLFLPAFITYHLDHAMETTRNYAPVFVSLIATLLISVLLVRAQPDLGTAILIFVSGSTLFWAAGLQTRWYILAAFVGILCAPLTWHCLKPYQKARIMVFLGHGQAHKERYQREQAIIAIGSGGLYGKGFLEGTQNKLQFLPEGRTDFIFAVLCEEWGFLGACFIIVLYLMLFFRLLYITWSMTVFHQQLLTFGLWIHIFLSTIVNMCMVLGMMPIVGIPLPFMSYGISHLWTTYASLGCIQSINLKRN
jgi:rod shape determining protein RodA